MKHYKVTWDMELGANSHLEAAELALEIHRNRKSTATVFKVRDLETKVMRIIDADE